MTTCSCFDIRVHTGTDAFKYIEEHLRLVKEAGYVVTYECPDHGKGWVLDWVGPEGHGGMRVDQARLRTFAEVRRDAIAALTSARALTDDEHLLGLVDEVALSLDALQEPPKWN